MKTITRITLFIGFCLIMVSIASCAKKDADTQYASDMLKKGTPAPAFTLNSPDGNSLSLSDFKGKYVVLDFWASWCPDCRKDAPEVVKAYQQFKDKGIEFLGKEKTQLVNFMPVSIPGLDAERLIFALEEQEVYLSTGAACAASKGEKSPTLRAIGLNDAQIAGSLRITLGRPTTDADVELAAEKIAQVVANERARLSK